LALKLVAPRWAAAHALGFPRRRRVVTDVALEGVATRPLKAAARPLCTDNLLACGR
jgi:hypothetical protein